MRKLVLLITAVLVALAAASALAATNGTYRGTTSQKLKMSVTVSSKLVQTVRIRWKTKDCTSAPKGYEFDSGPFFHSNTTKNPIKQSGGFFTQDAKTTAQGNGIKAVITAHVHGHFDGRNVSGNEKTSSRIDDKFGHHTCKSSVRWSAKR